MIRRLLPGILLISVVFARCHSRKAVLKGSPGETMKPQRFIAEKYADMMQVDRAAITNGRLYSFIEEWQGTPYRFGGMGKDGIDCSGLACLIEQEVYGLSIPRMTSQQVKTIKRKFENELQEGDLVFFDFDGKQFSHVGVYLQNGFIVHASAKRGVMVANLHDPSLYKYFSRAGAVLPVIAVTQP